MFCYGLPNGEYFVEFLLSGGVYFFWLELVEFRLYLGASLCTYIFSSYHVFDGIFMLGGVLCFVGTLYVSCFKLLIDFIFMSYSLIFVLFVCLYLCVDVLLMYFG